MKGRIRILLSVLSLCMAVWAEDVRLDEFVVLGRAEMDAEQVYSVIDRIGYDEIAQWPVANVADVLAYIPTLDIRSRGTSAAQTDISLRGGTFDQVVVLLNGIPLQDPQTGHYAMNIPIPLALVERIEVLQGPGADLPGALTGAINIVTRYVDNDTYSLSMQAGTDGEVHPTLAGTWRRGKAQFLSSVEYSRSEGFYAPTTDTKEQAALMNTDYQLANIFFRAQWRGLEVQTGAQYKDAGLGTGYGYASTDQLDATRTMFVSALYDAPVSDCWSIRGTAVYRGQFDRYEWHRGTPTNRHWTHNADASFDARYHWWGKSAFYTQFGAAFRHETIRSTNMGAHDRWQLSAHAKQQVQFGAFYGSLSAAAHYNSWCGWYGSGAAQVEYKWRNKGHVYVSANRSLRMPTWTDMYYKAGVQRGSTDLKAEHAWQVSAGGQYRHRWEQAGQIHVSADAYYRWGQDIIDWTFDETDSLFHATNQNSVNTFGIECAAEYRLNRWLRSLSVRYAYTNLSLDVAKTKSSYLDYLRHKIGVALDHGIYVWSKGCVGAHWSLRWQQREGTYVDIHGTAGCPFAPVLLLDGSVYVELEHLRIALEGTNLTNRHYYDYGGVLMPGTHGRIHISAQL